MFMPKCLIYHLPAIQSHCKERPLINNGRLLFAFPQSRYMQAKQKEHVLLSNAITMIPRIYKPWRHDQLYINCCIRRKVCIVTFSGVRGRSAVIFVHGDGELGDWLILDMGSPPAHQLGRDIALWHRWLRCGHTRVRPRSPRINIKIQVTKAK